MLEGLLGLVASIGVVRGLLARRGWALLGGLVVLYLLTADTLNVLAASFADLRPMHLFIFMFLGVGTWHRRGIGPLPLPDLFVHDPLTLKLARGATSAVIAWRCFRAPARAGRSIEPESVAMPFVTAAAIDAAELLLMLFARAFADRS